MRSRAVRVLTALLVSVMILSFTGILAEKSYAQDDVYTARPSVNGKLHLENGRITDGSGMQVQLRGVSTHGLTWFPEYVNADLFEEVSRDWNCNLLRLPAYTDLYTGVTGDEYARLMHMV